MKRKQSKSRESEMTSSPDGIHTADEERLLAEAIRAGDTVAREQMILAHRGLAAKIASGWKGRGLNKEDLVSEAMCGLIRAVDQFDPSREVRFSTFASFWIKQSLSRAVESSASLIALPSHMCKLIRNWKRAARGLATALGRVPTTDEIAHSLGLTSFQASHVVTAMTIGVKLASTIMGEGCLMSPLETCTDPQPPCEEQEEERVGPDEGEILRRRLKRLDVHERMVLVLRYGLDGNRPWSLERLSGCVGINRHLVKEIQLRAEEKLRAGPNPRARRRRPADS
jgi:RNA polymerase sigma factor (sigma-70 family)